MGRSAGHLAVAMAIGSGSHLVSIQEEFPPGAITVAQLADLVEAAILKRMAAGEGWGLAVLAEGLLDQMSDPEEMSKYVTDYDEHGHPRLSEIDLGKIVHDVVDARFKERGVKMAFITKIIGYELRCADPIAFDVQYTRTLGFGAVEFLANGSGNALISLQAGKLVPIRFDELGTRPPARCGCARSTSTGASGKRRWPCNAACVRPTSRATRWRRWPRCRRKTPPRWPPASPG